MGIRQISAALAAAVGTASVVLGQTVSGSADPLSAPPNRVGGVDGRFVVFTGATVRVDPDTTVTNATLVVRGGLIESVREGSERPLGARVVDARGLYIYPGFVDAFVEVDAARPDPASKGAHWNYHVMPQRRALDGKGIDEGTADALRKLGFTAAGLSPRGGVFRGSGAAVSLAKPDAEAVEPRPTVYNPLTYHALSFEGTGDAPAGSDGRWGGYPSSQMGAIALIRQTLLDAEYRRSRVAGGLDAGLANCLDALAGSGEKNAPLLFSVNDELEELRAWAVADEFNRGSVVIGNGTEYKRLDAIAAHKTPLIVPLNFPEKPRVAGIGDAANVELRELMSWEQAPTNPRRLKGAGVEFSFTSSKLRDRSKFRENLRQAVRHGLSERDALAALTVTPAALLGIGDKVGTIAPGKAASFFVADGPFLEKKSKLLDVYCDGVRHVINAPSPKVDGVYEMTVEPPPPGEARRFLTIDTDGGVTVRRGTKEEAKPAEAKPAEPKPDAPKPEAAKPGEPKPREAGAPKPEAPTQPKPDEAKPGPKPEAAQPPALPAAEPEKPAPSGPVWKEKSIKAKNVVAMDDRISFVFDHEALGGPTGMFTHSGLVVERDGQGRAALIKGDGTRATGEPFTWTGRRLPESDWLGAWRVSEFEGNPKPAKDKDQLKMEFSHGPEGLKLKLTFTKEKGEPTVIDAEDVKLEKGVVTFKHSLKKLGGEGDSNDTLRMEGAGAQSPVIVGEGVLPDGSKHPYKAERWKSEDDEAVVDVPEKLTGLPFGPYAREKLPEQYKTVVLFGGTVWTSGPEGRIEDCDVIVQDGKIVEVGKGLRGKWIPAGPAAPGVLLVDCRGKHLTPGIIDCHSHTGISRGVNEGGQAVTAEVRVGDVTNPDAISWYRQLAGGVTTINNLHGSSNPIGGQNQVNKNRWGASNPNDLHFDGAIPGIKFALGENVKGGNSTQEGWRYPQTRMGVETLIRDRFTAAREYLQEKKRRSDGETKWKEKRRGEDQDASRSGGMAERNGPDDPRLRGNRQDAENGTVRLGIADATSGRIDSGEHRGGIRTAEPSRSAAAPSDRQGLASRVADAHGDHVPAEDARCEMPAAGSEQGDGSGSARLDPLAGEEKPVTTPSLLLSVSSSHRVDLELEALGEILEGKRLIHCHSYRQDEILMLGRVAEEFGFKIGTYQHILEGYKVADIVRDSSGGGSCFSDWWAYKVEVQDAIPQGGPIMAEQGVVVSFNSDDDGMARRMNVEAAKGRKYSRLPDGTYTVSEEDALKFITINPAKQLRIDSRVGSIEKGKDADIAVWNGSPLSSLSRCERTFVDGRQQFSLEEDARFRERDGKERQRLIQKILADKGGKNEAKPEAASPAPGGPPAGGRRRPPTVLEMVLHDAAERRIERALDLIRRGRSEEDAAKGGGAGACGCDEIEMRSNR